jgi:hypothetical protein
MDIARGWAIHLCTRICVGHLGFLVDRPCDHQRIDRDEINQPIPPDLIPLAFNRAEDKILMLLSLTLYNERVLSEKIQLLSTIQNLS